MNHNLYDRDDGLHHCSVCGGAEASLPVNCPGRRMTDAEERAVEAGTADFVRGVLVRAEVFGLHARAWRFVVGDLELSTRAWPYRFQAAAELRLRLRAMDTVTTPQQQTRNNS